MRRRRWRELDRITLEKRVDKRLGRAAAQDNQQAHQQENQDNGQEPPLLVVLQKLPELTDEARALLLGQLSNSISRVFGNGFSSSDM